jgi:AAA+ ATPase superfamily predicted ATPase
MMFINRETELQILEERFSSGQAEFFVLYGRRRVGKTELLTRFCQDKRHIFFVADLDAEPTLRASLSSIVNAKLLGTHVTSAVYPSWEDIFLLLAEHAQTDRLVVVIDEFTYLVTSHPPIASTLQRIWDSDLRHTNMMLILCGSYIGMMEEAVLGYRAPLYGRRTGQYFLEPLNFHNARLFFPSLGLEDQIRAYAVLGGTPAYLQNFSNFESLQAFIANQILKRGTFLFDEVRFLLQQELREPRNYFAVLESIAAGRTRLNEIKQATGLDGATAYISTLQNLHLVKRVVPVTERQPHKSRRGLYQLSDHYFRFWFRFLHPNRTLLEQGGNLITLESFVTPQIDTFTGPVFEEICQQYLWQMGLVGALPFTPSHLGGWWRANQEVDIVALGDGNILLVECKWSSRPLGIDILQNLEQKTNQVLLDTDAQTTWYGLCSRSGFTSQVKQEAAQRKDLILFDLPDIVPKDSPKNWKP